MEKQEEFILAGIQSSKEAGEGQKQKLNYNKKLNNKTIQ